MAVMPVSPIASVPSSRGQSGDGSATDPHGFGSLLGGLDADASDSGGTAGGAASGGSGPPPAKSAAASTDKPPASPANGTAQKAPDSRGAEDGRAAKAAGPANGAARPDGASSRHDIAGKPGKRQAKDDDAAVDPNAAAASASLAAAAPVPAAVSATTGQAAGADAAAPLAPATGNPGLAEDAAALASALTTGATGPQADAALAAVSEPPIDAATSPAAAQPSVDAAPLAAASAFGNAVLDAAIPASPLTGNPATPATPDATAPSIAASLLATLKTSSSGGAPAAALIPTGPGAQSVVATPSQLLAPLPEASAAPIVSQAPIAAAAPQASIAPAIAAAISVLSEMTGDRDRIVIRALPHGAAADGLHNDKGAAFAGPAGGAQAASFGNALFPAGSIPGLAAALLGGTDDQASALADGLLHSANEELAASAVRPEKADGEAHGSDAVPANGHESGQPLPGFAAALAHTESSGQTNSTESARPAQLPAAMPPMPALQIMPSLTKAAGDGGGRFNIQLHPQELGRVRVELDIDHDGHVTAAISAAHPATLDLLRRDAAALQQTLNDAGLKTDGNALSFNLQGNGQDMADGSGRSSRSSAPVVPPAVDPLEDAAPKSNGAVSLGAGLVAVDIRI